MNVNDIYANDVEIVVTASGFFDRMPQLPCSAIFVRLSRAPAMVHNSRQPPPVVVQEATSKDLKVIVLRAQHVSPSHPVPCLQHIHGVPGLNQVTMAVVVEMQLAPGLPYHHLPLPPLLPVACEPKPPPVLLSITAEALTVLLALDNGDAGTLAQGQDDLGGDAVDGCRGDIASLIPPLLHVCMSAVAGRAHILPEVNGWWQPCALHVQVDSGDEATSGCSTLSSAAWQAAASLMQFAASQWPLAKVRLLPIYYLH